MSYQKDYNYRLDNPDARRVMDDIISAVHGNVENPTFSCWDDADHIIDVYEFNSELEALEEEDRNEIIQTLTRLTEKEGTQ